MAYHADNRTKRVIASAQITHGNPAADDGHVGQAIKTLTPPADTPRANLSIIAAAEAYNLVTHGEIDAPLAGLEAAGHGDMIYIDSATNALSINNPGAGRQPLGKVSSLAGERGGPVNRIRVDLDEKVI